MSTSIALPTAIEHLPRIQLTHAPTPLQEATRLAFTLNCSRIFVKRDDCTGLAGGGNKTRKLEFLMADALSHGADCIITTGAEQSNHCRQSAAAAARLGLECHLVLSTSQPRRPVGNHFLDLLLGARIHWSEKHRRTQTMVDLADDLRAYGKRPYTIPVGASNSLGAMGYVVAMFELQQQLNDMNLRIDRIVFATSSGGTHAGLVLGAALCGFEGKITGISIDQTPNGATDQPLPSQILDMMTQASALLELDLNFHSDDIDINYDYLGQGYGIVGKLEREAISLLATQEGILLGPIYTGRAMGALIDMIGRSRISSDEQVLFWHTGDDLALHAYTDDILPSKQQC